MAYKPKKWPSYAQWGLEDSLVLLKDLDEKGKQVQELGKVQRNIDMVILGGDICRMSMTTFNKLIAAKLGEYEDAA